MKICKNCGKTIELRRINPTSNNFRWFTSHKANSWHCGADPEFTVRTHSPKEPIMFSSTSQLAHWHTLQTNEILTRFRAFQAERDEDLTPELVEEFLTSKPSWWLVTNDKNQQKHAAEVLERLDWALQNAEIEELNARARLIPQNKYVVDYLEAINEGGRDDPQQVFAEAYEGMSDLADEFLTWLAKRNPIVDAFRGEWQHDATEHVAEGWLADISGATYADYTGRKADPRYVRLPGSVKRATAEQRLNAAKIIAHLILVMRAEEAGA